MNIRRGSKIYTRVGDFDPPTHQPTSIYNLFHWLSDTKIIIDIMLDRAIYYVCHI